MTDAYFVHDDNYDAMKKDRDRYNSQKKAIREYNAYLEQKLAEDEDEEIEEKKISENKVLVKISLTEGGLLEDG